MDKLKEFKFEKQEELGKNIFVETGIVADIISDDKKEEITICFFNEPRAEIYSQTIKLTIDVYNKKILESLNMLNVQ